MENDAPAGSLALNSVSPSGSARTPGWRSRERIVAASSVDWEKVEFVFGANARCVTGMARSPEMPEFTNPVERPVSSTVSTATRAMTAPISMNRPHAWRRSRSPTNTADSSKDRNTVSRS